LQNPRFLERNFTKNEITLFGEKHKQDETIAGNFAVKEAVSKALGTGVTGFWFNDIEVLRNKNNKPYINFYGNIKDINEKFHIDVSISHNESTAIAMVVMLKK